MGVLERGSGTSGSHPSGSGSISATAPPLSATTRTSRVPSSRTVDAASASAPSTIESSVEPAEGVAESSHEPPRLATVPGRSNSTDPLGTWTTSGPASVPRSRVSGGTGWLADPSWVSCVQAAAPSAATDSATTGFLSIWDLPVRLVRARLPYLQASMTTTPRGAARFPGTGGATGGSAPWRDRIEEESHAQGSMDRRRDARRGDARGAFGGVGRRRRVPGSRPDALSPGSDGARRGVRVRPSGQAAPVRTRAVLPLRRAGTNPPHRGPADPRARRSSRDDLDRSRGRDGVRAERVLRGPAARRRVIRARGLQRAMHDLGLSGIADGHDLGHRHGSRRRAAQPGRPPEAAGVELAPAGAQIGARGRGASSPTRPRRGGPLGAGHPRPRARSRRRTGNPIGPTSVGPDVGGADPGRRVVRLGARARGPTRATPRAGGPRPIVAMKAAAATTQPKVPVG